MSFDGRSACLVACVLLSAACSPATMGMNRMADALTATAAAYAKDDDPELVRIGAPATLKMIEMMLDAQPAHPGLLLSACSGFTQYAYAFLQVESEMLGGVAAPAGEELAARAVRMYARARGYCLRALATTQEQLADAFVRDPKAALTLLESATKADVPALYWTAASWAGEFRLVDDQLLRMQELALIRALFSRALALDDAWGNGAIHEAMVSIEGLPVLLGGSPARARQHFERAIELSKGESAFPYVTLAAGVSVRAGNRPEFEQLLKQALAIDVSRRLELRLANLVAQKRARHLLATADALFKD